MNTPTLKAPTVKVPAEFKAVKVPKTKPALVTARITAPDYILALDMSLSATGYSLINLITKEVSMGVIEPKAITGMERLAFLRQKISSLAEYGRLPGADPSFDTLFNSGSINCLVLIEGYAFGAKGQAVISLGELGGAIRLKLYESKIPYIEIAPTALKKFITGKGNSPKQIMLKEVYKRFGEDINDDNIADAFSLMQLGCALVDRETKPLVQFQQEVVSDVVKTYFKEKKLDVN